MQQTNNKVVSGTYWSIISWFQIRAVGVPPGGPQGRGHILGVYISIDFKDFKLCTAIS